MDKKEARQLLDAALTTYRARSYGQLVAQIGSDDHLVLTGPSNIEYQIEVQILWDNKPGGDVRVMAGIDDGRILSAMVPLCADFAMSPDGRFVGES
jgi:hypothetical protein